MHRGLCYRLCPIIYKVVPFYLLFGTTLGEGSAILSIVCTLFWAARRILR